MQENTVQAAAAMATDDSAATQQAAEIAKEIQDYLADTDARFEGLDKTLNTQGKAGQKLPRINMAFSVANYDYIKTMASLEGTTMTVFLNKLIDLYRKDKDKSEPYLMAKKLQAMVRAKNDK